MATAEVTCASAVPGRDARADADERDGFATRNSVEQRRQVCGIAKRDHGRVEKVQRRYCKHVARAYAGKRGGAQSIS